MLQEIQKFIHASQPRPAELVVPDHRLDELVDDLNIVTNEFDDPKKITADDVRNRGLVLFGIPVRIVAEAA